MEKTISQQEIEMLYKALTPENKVKFIQKYYELLAEQERESKKKR